MKSFAEVCASLAAVAALLVSPDAMAQSRAQYDSMVASHARANNVPEALVHRVIVRESKYHPGLVGRGGTIGLMQIKLPTARGLGYTGDAAGLRDPDTNLAWGIKYLAGAYRAANGDHSRAVRYYASGYYYAAKRQRQERPMMAVPVLASECAAENRRQAGRNGENACRRERDAGTRQIVVSWPRHVARRRPDRVSFRARSARCGAVPAEAVVR